MTSIMHFARRVFGFYTRFVKAKSFQFADPTETLYTYKLFLMNTTNEGPIQLPWTIYALSFDIRSKTSGLVLTQSL